MRVAILIFLGISSSVNAKTFICNDLVQKDMVQVTTFDSNGSSLQSALTFLNPNNSVKSKIITDFLTPRSVCEITLDFKSECKILERENRFGYDFSFTCPKLKIIGSFYVNETVFGQYQCESPSTSERMIAFDCSGN
jgi:hypothetical protein